MLKPVVGNRPHALGDRLVLKVNTLDPTVDRIPLLRGAVDLPIVTWIGRQPEASEPVRRVRQKFVAAFCAADRLPSLNSGCDCVIADTPRFHQRKKNIVWLSSSGTQARAFTFLLNSLDGCWVQNGNMKFPKRQ